MEKMEPEKIPTNILDLPSVFICKLFSYLDWKTKLDLVTAIPHWTACLYSGEAWFYVSNSDRSEPTNSLYEDACLDLSCINWTTMQIDSMKPENVFDSISADKLENDERLRTCIREYGKFFQRCKLILEFDDVYMSQMDLTILNLVLQYCNSLRSITVHFPRGLGFKILECLEEYRQLLNSVSVKCPRLKNLCIHFHDYTPVHQSTGISELFNLKDETGLISKITALDFSYVYSLTNQPRAEFLTNFSNLRILRTEEHLLSTNIVFELCRNGLQEMYLVHKDTMRDNVRVDDRAIDWCQIAEKFSELRVYYIYEYTVISTWSHVLKPNPLLHTLVMDSLIGEGGHALLFEEIGLRYGKSLRVFAQLANEWSFMPFICANDSTDPDSSYSTQLLENCPKLEAFYTGLTVSSSDLIAMADSEQLKIICVNCDEIFYDLDYVEDQVRYLDTRLRKVLGDGWKPLPKEEFPLYTQFLTHLKDDKILFS